MRHLIIAAALSAVPIGFAAGPASAQGPVNATAPAAAGSAQRRAILDALRPTIQQRLGPNIVFVVRDIRVSGGWAFVKAEPQRRGGRPIDGSAYFPNFDDMDGLTVTALLRFQRGRWSLVDHAIGATDAWYCGRNLRTLVGC